MIGSAEGVFYAAGAVNESGTCTCELAVTEGTWGKNFLRHFFRITLIEKAKLLVRTVKAYYSIRHKPKTLSKVRKVYFNDPDIRTKAFNLIPASVFDDVDMIFLVCDDASQQIFYKASDYAARLMEIGVSKDKIFVVPYVMCRAELPLFVDGELSPLCKKLADVKPVMRYMEYQVTDFCNLKCKRCEHLANYVKTLEFVGAEYFRFCLEKLSEKFENITTFRIMGGEPLLCRNLHEYINAVHEVFPYSQIKIVTNGLLYKNITPQIISAIRNAGAEIQVSQYPPSREIADKIAAFCMDNGLKLYISSPVKEFSQRVISDKSTDVKKTWAICLSKHCRFLRNTTLYPCWYVWAYSHPEFQGIITKERAVTESECAEVSYDLTKNLDADGWDILAAIDGPLELCRKCGDKHVFYKWESERAGN